MKFSILAIGELEPDFVSRCIERKIGENYSHSAILVDDKWVYHATGKGFHMAPLVTILPGHAIRHRIDFELFENELHYAMGWLEGNTGKPYSRTQLLGFEYKFLRHFVENANSKYVCSEAVAVFMFKCLKIKDPRLLASEWVTPRDATEIAYAAQRARAG